MAVQRSNRGSLVRVALVLLYERRKIDVDESGFEKRGFAENKLFATLDTTVRKVVFDNLPFLLSDTVGFYPQIAASTGPNRSSRRSTRCAKPTCCCMWVDISHRISSRSTW